MRSMKTKPFFQLKTAADVEAIIRQFAPRGAEEVGLFEALGRIAAEDLSASEDLPEFHRSTMDGYAIAAADSFGASESAPVYLAVKGEVLMGQEATQRLGGGEAIRISTGGMLPEGADAVVLVEHTKELRDGTLEAMRAVAPWANVLQVGADFRRGDVVVRRGARLRAQELGALAGLGITRLRVYDRPRVALLTTGDEIVEPEVRPRLGEVRNINRYTLLAMVRECGAVPVNLGHIQDDYESIAKAARQAIEEVDLLLVSGGSSMSMKDYSAQILHDLGEPGVLVHGVSIKPGKPLILARIGDKAAVGIPGHPVSAMIVAEVFVKPLIAQLSGCPPRHDLRERPLRATLQRNVASAPGREDYVRVVLSEQDGALLAMPILGNSAMISTMIRAQGYIRIGIDTEGLPAGATVEVYPF